VIAIFMAKRIIDERNSYMEVVTVRPDLKDGIDAYLVETGHGELIHIAN